jgi:hypothetical protein
MMENDGEIKTQNRNSLIISGIGEDKEHKKVGILTNKEAQKSLMECSPILERIILARFKT